MTEPVLTNHARFRLHERLTPLGYSKKQIINDLKKGIKRIKGIEGGKYIMYGQLACYIITKDKIVITVLSYNKDKGTTH